MLFGFFERKMAKLSAKNRAEAPKRMSLKIK